MARAFVDVNMFSETWFAPVLKELLSCKNVVFPFGNSDEFKAEFDRCRKGLEFYKIVGQLKTAAGKKRRLDVDAEEIDRHVSYLSSQQCFSSSSDCDDPHIFSLVYAKPTRFIFSMDARMARCRDHINQFIDSRYCNFILISDAEIYRRHRSEILQ